MFKFFYQQLATMRFSHKIKTVIRTVSLIKYLVVDTLLGSYAFLAVVWLRYGRHLIKNWNCHQDVFTDEVTKFMGKN